MSPRDDGGPRHGFAREKNIGAIDDRGVFEALPDARSDTESITLHPTQIVPGPSACCARPPFAMDRRDQREAWWLRQAWRQLPIRAGLCPPPRFFMRLRRRAGVSEIQIDRSGKVRLLRPFLGAMLRVMCLEALSLVGRLIFGTIGQPIRRCAARDRRFRPCAAWDRLRRRCASTHHFSRGAMKPRRS